MVPADEILKWPVGRQFGSSCNSSMGVNVLCVKFMCLSTIIIVVLVRVHMVGNISTIDVICCTPVWLLDVMTGTLYWFSI